MREQKVKIIMKAGADSQYLITKITNAIKVHTVSHPGVEYGVGDVCGEVVAKDLAACRAHKVTVTQ